MHKYYVDIETTKENSTTLETTFFDDYTKAEEFYNRSKKKDHLGQRYTFSVAFCMRMGKGK